MNLIVIIQETKQGNVTIDFEHDVSKATEKERAYTLAIRELIVVKAPIICKALGGHGAMLTRGNPHNQ